MPSSRSRPVSRCTSVIHTHPGSGGTNENTNGLLRQYFLKSTDLSLHGPGILNNVAAELNGRPRQTLGWDTPAERLNDILNQQTVA